MAPSRLIYRRGTEPGQRGAANRSGSVKFSMVEDALLAPANPTTLPRRGNKLIVM